MTETSTEQIPHVTNEPAVMQAPVNTAVVASSPGKWIINGTNKICIIAQMSAFFNVSYVNATKMPSFKTFNLPAGNRTVNVSGNCGETEQNLTLTWSDTNVTNASMTMHFMKNATEKHYSLHHLELTLQATDFPNRNQSLVLVNETKSYFEVGVSYAYKCLRQQKLDLKQNNTNETSGYVILWDLEFVAFKADNSAVFGLAQDCAFNTPDVVPIAVGCILSILVVFVLIAYTIGRRRNQNHGYRSM
ncbi:Lysosome-associated membrane glycoprotein 1 [Habropoda laboriosa]|uniref:Lysosome-associated membrane glycoprotein 5 n=2 Tax=Habropoda laboriosa TaxID=597456 RepID=A0A0L7QJT3_9HYME|nr:Lysosome-associated membrane glycoprotein 1 [Habropoda laboriosa]